MRLCLAGGATPGPAYAELAKAMFGALDERGQPMEYILVPGDERLDARDDSERNETLIRFAFGELLDDGQARLMPWSRDDDAADTMDRALAQLADDDGTLFDVCYLGLGADGHTAGLFPGYRLPFLGRTVETMAPSPPRRRVSLTLEALRASAHTRFLVSSRRKEAALAAFTARDPRNIALQACTKDTLVFVLS